MRGGEPNSRTTGQLNMDKVHWWTQGRVLTYPICGGKPNSQYERTHKASAQSEVTCPECRRKLAKLDQNHSTKKPTNPNTDDKSKTLKRTIQVLALIAFAVVLRIAIASLKDAGLWPFA